MGGLRPFSGPAGWDGCGHGATWKNKNKDDTKYGLRTTPRHKVFETKRNGRKKTRGGDTLPTELTN